MDVARFAIAREAQGAGVVPGVDRGAEAVVRIVGERQGLVDVGRRRRRHHRAEDLAAHHFHVGLGVGEDGRGVDAAVAAPAGHHPGAGRLGLVDPGLDALGLLLLDHRRELGALLLGRAHLDLLDLGLGRVEEVAVDGAVDDGALQRDAHLAGVGVAAVGDVRGHLLQVRVRQHHHGAVRAQLERQLLEAGDVREPLPDFHAAGEADLARARVGCERLADLRARAGDHLQLVAVVARLVEQLGEHDGRQRRDRGRLEDDRVAGRQRRRDLVQREHQREVERRDRDDDAAGDPHGHADLAGAVRGRLQRQLLAAYHGALESAETDDLDRAGGLGAGLGERLAVLGGDRRGEVLDALLQQLGRLEGREIPFVRAQLALLDHALGGGGEGALGVLRLGGGYLVEDLAIIGMGDRQGLVALLPFAGDVVLAHSLCVPGMPGFRITARRLCLPELILTYCP